MAASAALRSAASKIATAPSQLHPRPRPGLPGRHITRRPGPPASSPRLYSSRASSSSSSSPCAGSTPPPTNNNDKGDSIRSSTNAAYFLLFGGLIVFGWVKLPSLDSRSDDAAAADAACRRRLTLEEDLTQTMKNCQRINAVLDSSSAGKRSMQTSEKGN